MNPLINSIVQVVSGIALPAVGAWGAMQLSKLYGRVDALPDWEKRILVVVYGAVAAGISHAIGVKLPDTWGSLGSPEIQAVLATGIAFVAHKLFKSA